MHAVLAPGGALCEAPRTSTSTSPRAAARPTGVTSTSASAGPSSAPSTSCAATPSAAEPHQGVRPRARASREATGTTETPASSSGAGSSTPSSVAALPGLIGYHEQHPLRLRAARPRRPRRERELGAAVSETSRTALGAYWLALRIARESRGALRPRRRVLVVVNDRRDLYPEILERAGLRLDDRLRRHVNRRTGRRAGEYFEDVLVARR